ncbi:MAG: cell division protein ZapA [Bacteroidales bacterium]|jgi:methionine salvage enolase-phosphatase E1|nr:cell division protein ZapA [Bacteroidales bacterium]
MADEKKSITLYVAQQPFRLSISAGEEELYHKAEKRIRDYTQTLAEKNNIHDKFTQLGYAVINFALNETVLAEKQKFVDTDLKNNLKKIQEVIKEVLNKTN